MSKTQSCRTEREKSTRKRAVLIRLVSAKRTGVWGAGGSGTEKEQFRLGESRLGR